MPDFRSDIREISPYRPGRPIADVAAEHGFDPAEVVKLASNENPFPPFAAVQTAIENAIGEINRYPDNEARLLRIELADQLGVSFEEVWVGGGSSELLRVTAMALGGPGTAAVYAWPSFVIYRLGSVLAMTERIEVPLDDRLRHDLDSMLEAITDDTTLVYVCNPNNPTGTIRAASAIDDFIEAVPERVMVLVDEAYHEYVTHPDHRTAIPHATERPNVMVLRTFSKIHGLATLRVGYAVTQAQNVTELRKAQAPFTVSTLGQVAALESLRHPDELWRRAEVNAAGRSVIESALEELGVTFVPSQANFVYFRMTPAMSVDETFTARGIIVRPFGDSWVRVSVGETRENDRLVEALRSAMG